MNKKLGLLIIAICLPNLSFASYNCNDFDVFVKNRSGANLRVMLQTPNNGQKVMDVENGDAKLIDISINQHHDETWAYIEIFRYQYQFTNPVLIYHGTVVKDRDGTHCLSIKEENQLSYDLNYLVAGEVLSNGYGGEQGQWRYTIKYKS